MSEENSTANRRKLTLLKCKSRLKKLVKQFDDSRMKYKKHVDVFFLPKGDLLIRGPDGSEKSYEKLVELINKAVLLIHDFAILGGYDGPQMTQKHFLIWVIANVPTKVPDHFEHKLAPRDESGQIISDWRTTIDNIFGACAWAIEKAYST